MALNTLTRDMFLVGAGIVALMTVMTMSPRLDQVGSWRATLADPTDAATVSTARGLRDGATAQGFDGTETIAFGRGRN